jgi:UDP-glucose 4-epimerase
MAFQRFIHTLLSGEEVVIYGDGEQTRDFTYVSDGVEANLLALKPEAEGRTFNIGGGARITINGALSLLEHLMGQVVRRRHIPSQEGDVRHTFADVSLAGRLLGYRPRVTLQEGLARQIEWARQSLGAPRGV